VAASPGKKKKSASNLLHNILDGEVVGAAGNAKLLNQELVDELALGILALLDGQELGQLREFLHSVGSIRRVHLVPVGPNVVFFTELREEFVAQLLVLPKSCEVVIGLEPVNLNDSKNTTELGVKVVGVDRGHVCIITLERTVLNDHHIVIGSFHAGSLGLLVTNIVGGGIGVVLDGKEVLDLSVELSIADTLGRARRGVSDFIVADVLLLAVTATIGAVVESAVAGTGIVGRLPVRVEVSRLKVPVLRGLVPVEVRTPNSHTVVVLVQLGKLLAHQRVIGGGIHDLGGLLQAESRLDLDSHLRDETEGAKADTESLQFFRVVRLVDDTEVTLRIQHTQSNNLASDIADVGSRAVGTSGGGTHEVLNSFNTEVPERQIVGLKLFGEIIDIPTSTEGDGHILLIDVELLQIGHGNDIGGLLGERIVDAGGEVTESMTISNNFDVGAFGVLLLKEPGNGNLIMGGNVSVRLASDLKLPVKPAVGGAKSCVQQHQHESQLRVNHFGNWNMQDQPTIWHWRNQVKDSQEYLKGLIFALNKMSGRGNLTKVNFEGTVFVLKRLRSEG
jgi:hypothetical protein